MRKILSLLLFFILSSISQGQNTGIYPPVHNWKQINTDTVRLIFPQGMEDKAQRVSFITHLLAKYDTLSFDQRLRKVNVFLINNTAESNGYIRITPFHGKFFSTAPQYAFAGTIDWFDLLSIHEYRHVMQMNGGTQGLPLVARKFLGESFWGTLLVLGAPSWFFEGDAVMQETAFSYSGRGRVPEFKMRFKSIANLEKPFSYEKMMCGSYKDIIPDQYALGYQLIEYGINNYGNDVWNKVYKDAITYKKLFYPFSRSMKKHTGLSTSKFYQEVINDHKNNNHSIEPWQVIIIGLLKPEMNWNFFRILNFVIQCFML